VSTQTELGEEWPLFVSVHRMLLRLAGQLPDEWLSHTRALFGGGDLRDVPEAVSGALAETGVTLTAAEVELLRRVLVALGDPPSDSPVRLDEVAVSEVTPATGHRFVPASPDLLAVAGERLPANLDLTGGASESLWDLPEDLAHLEDLADDLTDVKDSGAAISLSYGGGTVGVWRAWRLGPDGGDGPPVSRRVYLAEVDPGVPAWEVETEARRALRRDGEDFPQVEVYWTGDELAPYHRTALANAALLQARRLGRVRPAATFDGPEGFAPDHPHCADADREALLARLRSGVPLKGTGVSAAADVVDPARGRVVPTGYRTDGRWVWSDAVGYYLDIYGLTLDPDLAAHLRTTEQPTTVDGVALFRAVRAVRAGSA
jgi:hypothetical protein